MRRILVTVLAVSLLLPLTGGLRATAAPADQAAAPIAVNAKVSTEGTVTVVDISVTNSTACAVSFEISAIVPEQGAFVAASPAGQYVYDGRSVRWNSLTGVAAGETFVGYQYKVDRAGGSIAVDLRYWGSSTGSVSTGPLAVEGGTSDNIKSSLQEMLTAKYAAYKSANNLPDNAGILVHLTSPSGNWLATAGLPAGIDENWHFRVASDSKTFTAAAIMLLDQQGKLKIDDVVTANIPGQPYPYLPDSPNYSIPYKSEITIRQLLSHRAGVFDVFNYPVPDSSNVPYAGNTYGAYIMADLNEPDHQFTLDELAGVVAASQASFSAPGAAYHYSDTGYNLLAKIIQRVSGKSYDRFLADNFFGPLGLKETSAPWSAYDNTLPSPFLVGYTDMGAGFIETTEDNMSSQLGPGNIVSTAGDVARWARGLLSGQGPLNKEQIGRMIAPAPGNATYGLGIGNSPIGAGHSGAHPGYVNLFGYNPDDDVAVVVVTPFIDYSNMAAHLALITDAGKEARRIAGYTGTWRK